MFYIHSLIDGSKTASSSGMSLNMASTIEDTITKLADTMVSDAQPGEKPKEIITKNVKVSAMKEVCLLLPEKLLQ
jgi:hypothetical protein